MRQIALMALGAVCVASVALAAAPAKPPAELATARKAYAAAVKAHDWNAVAALVNFPVDIEVYQVPPKVTKAQFLKNHQQPFIIDDAGQLKCVGTAPATYQGSKKDFGYDSWNVDCDGNEYFFGLRGGKWLLTGYQNINE